ncbi:hypothetical protein FZI85_30295 [Mycobacterium sp. CBMA293]|uniref:hypothetical protein n=1 Tax=unclassified Mycolicibacterium TaxID=2636767 RepID=UPI0012DC22F5|nr:MULTISPECIES: hypothetical protein [unclassified Mycolicibacterium]MUL50123.1 hypothetical protein [Mycolicibacterium sp. CBMA 360]MUL62784.1 hypothetical protein [Mycolicibacterium sp. CBMA 335]MUL67487.1 hypothetical protein [Mycolicibacterium sp. CBMA 234]MUL71985.1 hypothetical protein [Mycolicibacterium sp. CBMA 311]MUL97422.1 hypothetical protein [Mycolicibacterium sp. CBMA 230]
MKRYFALAGAASAFAMSLGLAPLAAADTYDTGGSAADVVNNLQAEGYLVQINWTNGFDTKPLDECWVLGINNPGNFKPGGTVAATVYVDVQCPNHDW